MLEDVDKPRQITLRGEQSVAPVTVRRRTRDWTNAHGEILAEG